MVMKSQPHKISVLTHHLTNQPLTYHVPFNIATLLYLFEHELPLSKNINAAELCNSLVCYSISCNCGSYAHQQID